MGQEAKKQIAEKQANIIDLKKVKRNIEETAKIEANG